RNRHLIPPAARALFPLFRPVFARRAQEKVSGWPGAAAGDLRALQAFSPYDAIRRSFHGAGAGRTEMRRRGGVVARPEIRADRVVRRWRAHIGPAVGPARIHAAGGIAANADAG